jgi:hypothetical protein
LAKELQWVGQGIENESGSQTNMGMTVLQTTAWFIVIACAF